MRMELLFFGLAIAACAGQASATDLDREPGPSEAVSNPRMQVSHEAASKAQDPCLDGDLVPKNKVVKKIFDSSENSVF